MSYTRQTGRFKVLVDRNAGLCLYHVNRYMIKSLPFLKGSIFPSKALFLVPSGNTQTRSRSFFIRSFIMFM